MTSGLENTPTISLRQRLLQVFLGLTIGPILLIVVISASLIYQSLKTQHLEILQSTANTVEQKTRFFFEQVHRDMVVLKKIAHLTNLNQQEQYDLVQSLLLSSQQYQTINIVDTVDKEVIGASRTTTTTSSGNDMLSSDDVRIALSTLKIRIGQIKFDSKLREPLVSYIYPLLDPRTGKARYVLVSELRLKPVWDSLMEVDRGGARKAYIINDDGRVVAHRNPSVSLRNTRVMPGFEKENVGLSGKPSIIYMRQVPLYNQTLKIVVEESMYQAYRPIFLVLLSIMITAFISIIIALKFLKYFRNSVIVPLEVLSKSARTLTLGNYPSPVKHSNIQEVEGLVSAFNDMVSELENAQERAKEFTVKLSAMNESLGQENKALENAEKQLNRNQQLLKHAQRMAQVGSWEWDFSTKKMWWSDELRRILNITDPNRIPSYQEFHSRFACEDKNEVKQAWRSPPTIGQSIFLNSRLLMEDGTEKFITQRIEVIGDENNCPTQLTGVMQDITQQKLSESAISQSEERYQGLMEQASDAMFVHDLEGHIIDVNRQACESLGYSREELLTMRIWDVVLGPTQESLLSFWSTFSVEKRPLIVSVHQRKDGTTFPVEVSLGLIPYAGSAILAMARDISDRQEIEENRLLTTAVFDGATEAIMVTDENGNILITNPAFSAITGYSADEVAGLPCSILKSGKQDEIFYQNMWQSLNNSGTWEGEIYNRRKNGELYPQWLSIAKIVDEQYGVTKYVALSRDITRRKQSDLKIWKQANFDQLTGLANRNLFRDRLDQALIHCNRSESKVCLMFIDLDRFKEVNDTLGHDVGDKLLQEAAKRLMSCVRSEDTVSRLGGDEFTVILQDLTDVKYTKTIAQKLLDILTTPFLIEGHHAYVSGSIGITIYPDDGDDVKALLKNADTAMYQSKSAGRDRYQFFTAKMNRELIERQKLEHDLRYALKNDQFIMYYQPIIDLTTGRLFGAEALVRWKHPERGIIPPDEFIFLAEEIGLITDLGEQVLRRSCQQMQSWLEHGIAPIQLSVNVSSIQFKDVDFISKLENILNSSGLPAEQLSLEITETVLLGANDEVKNKLDAIRALKASLSLDDFGTGYSSLSYLKNIPVNTLKIDRLFIQDIAKEETDCALVEAIILMSKRLNLKVVAEGVETKEQLKQLRTMGCDFVQGYYYDKPLPLQEFKKQWIERPVFDI